MNLLTGLALLGLQWFVAQLLIAEAVATGTYLHAAGHVVGVLDTGLERCHSCRGGILRRARPGSEIR